MFPKQFINSRLDIYFKNENISLIRYAFPFSEVHERSNDTGPV